MRSWPSSRLNLGIVGHNLVDRDGQGRWMLEIARSLVASGHKLTIYCIGLDEELARHPSVRWIRPIRKAWGPQLLTDLRLFVSSTLKLRKDEFDLVCVLGPCAQPRDPYLFFAAFSQAGWRDSWSMGGRPDLYRRIHSLVNGSLERFVVRRARGIVAMSGSTRDELKGMQTTGSRTWVSPGGVDPKQFPVGDPEDAVAIRRKLGIPLDALMVGFVGEFATARKGLVPLVRSVEGLEGAHVVVRGSGDESQVSRVLRDAGCTTPVSFVGKGPAQEVYQAANIVAIPSLYEPFSLVALEAAASGVPVVISRVAGAASFIEDAKAGLLVDPLDPSSVRAAVQRVLEDPGAAAEMGAAGRRLASDMTWPQVSQVAVQAIEETARTAFNVHES